METRFGKIQKVTYGMGGYQDAQFGLTLTLGGEGWGVGTFRGQWASPPSPSAQWTEESRKTAFGDDAIWLIDIMTKAKVTDVSRLAGIPVEVTFDGNMLKSWRVLEEVL